MAFIPSVNDVEESDEEEKKLGQDSSRTAIHEKVYDPPKYLRSFPRPSPTGIETDTAFQRVLRGFGSGHSGSKAGGGTTYI
ncbi:hypothetical protein C8R42DRAFT_717841 [Lentinula raphanica]|nr:hypothetical protein C8R42DRAFT_717841 [Lentinula raphanica]